MAKKVKGWAEHLVSLDNLSGRALFHAGEAKPERKYGMDYTPVQIVVTAERVFTESEVRAILNEVDSAITIEMEDGDSHGPWAKACDIVRQVAFRNGLSDPA